MARILFLNPAFYGVKDFVRTQRWFARTRGRVARQPDYALIAVAVLEEAGNQVKFIDASTDQMPFESILEEAGGFRPQMVIVPTTTPSIYNDIDQLSRLKRKTGAMNVLIGSHVSALPEESLGISEDVDVVVRGEYDYTLRDLARVADGEMGIGEVRGITYRDSGKVRSSPDRPFIEDLDEMPFPAWQHVDPKRYFDAGKLYPFLTLIAGRGCPNMCSFCLLPQTLYGRRYRLRSARNIVDEIEHDIMLFPYLKEIMFEDDTLTANRKRCREICEEIIRRGLHKKISFSGNSRADIFDLGLLRLMRRAGFRMLVVGYEFGDQEVLDRVNKNRTVGEMKRFAVLARKAGIKIHGCFMVGGPGETEETARKTLELVKALRCDTIQISALIPYPGTEFYRYCEERNLIKAKDWTEWVDGGEQCTVIEYPGLSKERIRELVDEGLYDNFYLRPRVWASHFISIKDLKDLRRKVKGFLSLMDYRLRR